MRPDRLLIWDRGFFSCRLWQPVTATKAQVLARVPSRTVLRPLRHLPDGSFRARLYPCESFRNRDEGGIVVRVIRSALNDPQRVGHGQEHVLIATLLDATAHPAAALIVLYHERWEIEENQHPLQQK